MADLPFSGSPRLVHFPLGHVSAQLRNRVLRLLGIIQKRPCRSAVVQRNTGDIARFQVARLAPLLKSRDEDFRLTCVWHDGVPLRR